MTLKFGFQWQDLYDSEKLSVLHQHFLQHLNRSDPQLYAEVYETTPHNNDVLIPLALAIESFIVDLFDLHDAVQDYYDDHHQFRLASQFKRNFIQREVLHAYSSAASIDGNAILLQLSTRLGQSIDPTNEVYFARLGLAALSRQDEEAILLFRQYAAWAYYSKEGQQRHEHGFLFKKPQPINPQQRFPIQRDLQHGITSPTIKPRTGFDVTDNGISSPHAVDEAFYCIKCHDRGKDTCRTGFKSTEGTFKNDDLGQPLSGCPLDQKISEMNVLFEHGQVIAALAVVTLDNPMVAATGHRICYDCARSCIFQKQDPVDIPSIETRLLKQVLALPYGFEIYSLLTRWNPLNLNAPYPAPDSGYHVLVVGQGPSGFALAHLMMQLGHRVTAIDGLKIEPLSRDLNDPAIPIQYITDHYERLSERYAKGFGGVAEYGITARWEKNFLFVIRLLLERRSLYQCLDGVRLGSNMTLKGAFYEHGFDHVALCLGAGSPTLLSLENMTIPGVRLASDFLMALHLGDAAKFDSKTTLRIQLPLAVIGAGLTAVDTATEALAYYPHKVMNFYQRYQAIVDRDGIEKANELLKADPAVAETFLSHGKILFDETLLAKHENRQPNYLPFLNEWGGVTVYYRKRIQDAPSYRLNPHELKSALMEGVRLVENATPLKIIADDTGRLTSVEFNVDGQSQSIALKTLLVAAGTKPNTVLAQEFPDLKLDGHFFKAISSDSFFVSATEDGRYVSYLGDLHPNYSGSVVKALASAKMAAPKIHAQLMQTSPHLKNFIANDFVSTITDMRVDSQWVHLTIYSPAAARAYQSGQFFKFQPYGTEFTEAIPLSPINVDVITGNIEFNIQIVGATTRKLYELQLNERVFLMGPAGSALKFPSDHRVLFITDPNATVDVISPIMNHICNSYHQIVAEIRDITLADFDGFNAVFITGSLDFVELFKHTFKTLHIPCYTFVHTHLQCMMKQVCAQCIYTTTDPKTGFLSVQFGCAKSIENIQKLSYPAVNKRNKNEQLEETILGAFTTH
ncbi:FAD-dependent oxidoreductase [Candidatus Bodocaedibacter vickermanii]|uniref:Glutamate synthase [NADPH] small chain n=1 Tax=Candidatus Bodocaedibacter vickermanii TaxID=2741701 RepID=A0A7L9RUU0_9PROT|nr:Glutamate synthase [NADPH] small chain [Candidatus Paracaedibacteraceae bacterium 'Lake Konstanz']